jgi:hypothetical protein
LILDKTLVVKTHKDHNGKYGRLLVDVFIGDKSLGANQMSKHSLKELDKIANDIHKEPNKMNAYTPEQLQQIANDTHKGTQNGNRNR